MKTPKNLSHDLRDHCFTLAWLVLALLARNAWTSSHGAERGDHAIGTTVATNFEHAGFALDR